MTDNNQARLRVDRFAEAHSPARNPVRLFMRRQGHPALALLECPNEFMPGVLPGKALKA